MNRVVLIGRLTRDPELKYVASSGRPVANFTLAVNRQFSKEDKADFFRIVVWGKQAESVSKYLFKGSQCAVSGSIQINQYKAQDGSNRYSTDIVADSVQFLSRPSAGEREEMSSRSEDDFDENFPQIDEDDIPF